MRLTVGMLRQVIREEVEMARRDRLYESVDPELKSLDTAAQRRGHAVDFNRDKIVKMSLDDCEDYGFPAGTLYCNVGGKEPYLKFPGKNWAHEADAQA
jgi:hypothetical protein